MKINVRSLCSALAALGAAAALLPITPSSTAYGATQISRVGTGSPLTGTYTSSGVGDVTQAEFPFQEDDDNGGPGSYPGVITNRSLSRGSGSGAAVNSGPKAKSHPAFITAFEGLNHYQQRYARG